MGMRVAGMYIGAVVVLCIELFPQAQVLNSEVGGNGCAILEGVALPLNVG